MLQKRPRLPKKRLLELLLGFLVLSILSGCFSEKESKDSEKQIDSFTFSIEEKTGLSKEKIILKTVHGNIVFKLYPKKAPNTSRRIVKLTNEGFYDGLSFHRVEPQFVIQTGDPTGTGTGGSGKNLKAEFNDLQHIRGSVAMARSTDPNSADSQFYITLGTFPHLDGKYTIFGQVVEGMEILDQVRQGDKIISMVFTDH